MIVSVPKILFLFIYSAIFAICQADNPQIPAELVAKAMNHVVQSGDPNAQATIQSLREGSIETLYSVAKSMTDAGDIASIEIWHQLADGEAHHIMSMVSLGFAYYEKDKQKAVKYFVQAGEDGPHQASLYDAGFLFIQLGDYPRALAYIRESAIFNGKGQSDEMTNKATEAYFKFSRMMKALKMSVQLMTNIFPYASIDGFPKEGSSEDKLWVNAMKNLQDYNESKTTKSMESARRSLSKLKKRDGLSDLQTHFIEKILIQTESISNNEL
jgi:tetratricopeptide (TPR) repeat protein